MAGNKKPAALFDAGQLAVFDFQGKLQTFRYLVVRPKPEPEPILLAGYPLRPREPRRFASAGACRVRVPKAIYELVFVGHSQ
jgi:hypothetical protein